MFYDNSLEHVEDILHLINAVFSALDNLFPLHQIENVGNGSGRQKKIGHSKKGGVLDNGLKH